MSDLIDPKDLLKVIEGLKEAKPSRFAEDPTYVPVIIGFNDGPTVDNLKKLKDRGMEDIEIFNGSTPKKSTIIGYLPIGLLEEIQGLQGVYLATHCNTATREASSGANT